jgi:hypothetical protein
MGEFLSKIAECQFTAIPNSILRGYKTALNTRVRADFIENTQASSYIVEVSGHTDCSIFRRSAGDGSKLYRWQLTDDALDSVLAGSLFDNDLENLNSFVRVYSEKLDRVREFCYHFHEKTEISEVRVFQPIFVLFVNDLIRELRVELYAKSANTIPLEGTIGLTNLKGYTDVMIFNTGADEFAENCCAFVELKPPFSSATYHSASSAAKDQTFAESVCLAKEDMPVVGALLDMFSIHLFLQVDGDCFITSHSVESFEFLKHLMVLFVPNADLRNFSVKKNIPISVTEDPDNTEVFGRQTKKRRSSNSAKKSEPRKQKTASVVKKAGSTRAHTIDRDEYMDQLCEMYRIEARCSHFNMITSSSNLFEIK